MLYGEVMDFTELVAMLQNPGEDGLPDSIYDDLAASYNGLAEGSASKVAELTASLQDRESEISRLKSMNYDLLISSNPVVDEETDNTSDDADAPVGVDSLF